MPTNDIDLSTQTTQEANSTTGIPAQENSEQTTTSTDLLQENTQQTQGEAKADQETSTPKQENSDQSDTSTDVTQEDTKNTQESEKSDINLKDLHTNVDEYGNLPTALADDTLKRVYELLDTNAHWIEQTRYCLVSTGELYKKFLVLEYKYNKSGDLLSTLENNIQDSYKDIIDTYTDFITQKATLQEQIDRQLAIISDYASQASQNAQNTQNALIEMQNIKDDIHTKTIEFYALRDQMQDLKEQLKEFETLIDEINTLSTRIKALKQEINEQMDAWKDEITTFLDNKKAELTTLALTKKDELNAHKDTLEAEITAHKEQSLAELSAKDAVVEQKHVNFMQNYQEAEQYIDETKAYINEQKEALQTQTNEHKADISTHAEDTKQNAITELNTHKDELTTTMTDDITAIKNSYLEEIHNDCPAQLADLTQLVNEIKASNQVLGNNFTSKTYRSSGTFSKVSGVDYYYIFVQGGTGGSNSSTAGSASSFGSIVSASGGAGNPNGNGQRGSVSAGFYQISNDSTTVTVANGGIVIVSYAQNNIGGG